MRKFISIFIFTFFFSSFIFCQLNTAHVKGYKSMLFSIYSFSKDTLNFSEDTLVVTEIQNADYTKFMTSEESRASFFKANLVMKYYSDSAFLTYTSTRHDSIVVHKDSITSGKKVSMRFAKSKTLRGTWKVSDDKNVLELDFPEWNEKSRWSVEKKENYYLFIRVKK